MLTWYKALDSTVMLILDFTVTLGELYILSMQKYFLLPYTFILLCSVAFCFIDVLYRDGRIIHNSNIRVVFPMELETIVVF